MDKHSKFLRKLQDKLWIVPAIVHVAGAIQDENLEDILASENIEQEVIGSIPASEYGAEVQRCARCHSIIKFNIESLGSHDTEWYETGTLVGKCSSEGHVQVYTIENRDLEDYEKECVGL